MDDDNVYRKLQGHLIVEFPEMVAILNAKNVEDTKFYEQTERYQERAALRGEHGMFKAVVCGSTGE